MVDSNTVEYYQRRQIQESKLAAQALDPYIAAIHRDMALRYNDLVGSLPSQSEFKQRIVPRIA